MRPLNNILHSPRLHRVPTLPHTLLVSLAGKLQTSTSLSGNRSTTENISGDQSGRYLFWLSRLKLTKYWPLSLNKICMGDIRSNTSGGRRPDIVIIRWSFCSLLTGLLSEVAWKIIDDKNAQFYYFFLSPSVLTSDKSGREMLFAVTEGMLWTGWKLLDSLRILISPETRENLSIATLIKEISRI